MSRDRAKVAKAGKTAVEQKGTKEMKVGYANARSRSVKGSAVRFSQLVLAASTVLDNRTEFVGGFWADVVDSCGAIVSALALGASFH